jgi:hypothetical protein
VAAGAAIATFAFLIGFALAGRPAPGSSPSPSPPPVFAPAAVSSELRAAYANVGPAGWALCEVEAPIRCQPIGPEWSLDLPGYGSLPLLGSTFDWASLATSTGPSPQPIGHYVLAGSMTLVGPQAALAKLDATGAGTLLGVDQTVIDGVVWVDLGTLDAGRYVGVVTAYSLQASAGPKAMPSGFTIIGLPAINATPMGWALGFVVGP